MNKKVLLTSAMALSSVVAMANPFADVPDSHWSFEAINLLASKGIVKGYTDGTFKGDKDVTRYQLAAVVARMLSAVEQSDKGEDGVSNVLNKDDLVTLKRLTIEFADELALLGVKITALEDDMKNVKDDIASAKKDVEDIKDKIENGGFDKVKISGDMLVRHDDVLKYKNGVNVLNAPLKYGQDTNATFRLRFDAKIDENVEASVRTVMYDDYYGSSLGGAAEDAGNQNDVDIAFIKLNDMVFGGNLKIGRDLMSHGSLLVMNDYVDAISFSKKAGLVDFELNMIYGNEDEVFGRNDKDIWNLNFDYETKGHNLHLGYYTVNYKEIVDNSDKIQYVDFDAKGSFGKDKALTYEVAYVMQKADNVMLDDLNGNPENKDMDGSLYHVALGYDITKQINLKLGYTAGNDEFAGGISEMSDFDGHYNHAIFDEAFSPLEDIAFAGYNYAKGGSFMNDASDFKVQLTFKSNDSKHSFRMAYDIYKQDKDGCDFSMDKIVDEGIFDINPNGEENKDEANIVTLEYRYKLAENTRLRLGYQTLDGKKASKDTDEETFYVEVYSKF